MDSLFGIGGLLGAMVSSGQYSASIISIKGTSEQTVSRFQLALILYGFFVGESESLNRTGGVVIGGIKITEKNTIEQCAPLVKGFAWV